MKCDLSNKELRADEFTSMPDREGRLLGLGEDGRSASETGAYDGGDVCQRRWIETRAAWLMCSFELLH